MRRRQVRCPVLRAARCWLCRSRYSRRPSVVLSSSPAYDGRVSAAPTARDGLTYERAGADRAGPGWADGPSIPVAVNAQPRSLPARDPDCCVVPCRSWRAVVFRPQTWRCAAPRRSIFANVASMSLVHLKASREDTHVRRLLSTWSLAQL